MPPELSIAAQEFEQTKQEKLLTANLVEELQEALPLSDHIIWGHGTLTDAIALTINNEGISANYNYDLFNIATPLTYLEKTSDENIDIIIQKAKKWPHKYAKFVVLIAVPFGIKPNNVIEHFDKDGKTRTRLPHRFIVGYLNMIENKFVANPSFERLARPTDGQIKRVDRFPKTPESNQEPQVIPRATVETDDDVW